MAARFFDQARYDLCVQVDRMFIGLLGAEWLALMIACAFVSPLTTDGNVRSIHPHFLAAILSGPVLIFPVILVACMMPGAGTTRHAIAISQMLISGLLIDVTGGRIETHFHIFGSLAFIAFYRDWRVLVTASAVTALDHAFRGWWWPQLVYGASSVSSWRWVEHTLWVLFEDFFLILTARRSVREMGDVALSQAWLHAAAYHDVLTGLPNRRLLEDAFESGRGARRAILFIDLDRFKEANDTLGHSAGDQLLTGVAQRLARIAGAAGILSRVGGDEFVLLTEEISEPEEALRLGAQVLDSFTEPFQLDENSLLISASVGISISPDHGSDLPTLRDKADQAMYAAKAKGRNQCMLFSQELVRRENVLRELRRDLFHATDRGQLSIHFQPLVGHDGEVFGFEALARWDHPVHGSIAPSEFIPLAEKSGYITVLGEWILRESCRQCKQWQSYYPTPVRVTVNASALQIDDPGLIQLVSGVLAEFSLHPSLLTLELTESAVIADILRTGAQLAALREIGVRIALDDFGTGYSSLSYLEGLPADFIKLDRYFATRDSAKSLVVLESVISLAHRVGLKVIGEGVETKAQKASLVGLRCDIFQGFLFGEPIQASLVKEYLQRSTTDLERLSAAVESASVLLCEILR